MLTNSCYVRSSIWLRLGLVSFILLLSSGVLAQGEPTSTVPYASPTPYNPNIATLTPLAVTPTAPTPGWFRTPMSTQYAEDGNGCPIGFDPSLSADLDPVYAASCSRCWATPTPHSYFTIPDMGYETPSGGLCTNRYEPGPTFTPFTQTPVGSWTPAPTFTPQQIQCGTPVPTATPTNTLTPSPVFTPSVTPTPGSLTVFRQEGDNAALTSPSTHFQGNFLSPASGSSVNATMGVFGDTITWNLGGWYSVSRITMSIYRSTGVGAWSPFSTWNPTIEVYSACGQLLASFSSGEYSGTFSTSGFTFPSQVITDKFVIRRAAGAGGAYLMLDWVETARVAAHQPACAMSTPTATPTATATTWYDWGINSPTPLPYYSCGLVRMRDDSPFFDAPDVVETVGYNCYTVVPELSVAVPGQGSVGLDGVQLCVTWVTFPTITFFGLVLSLDWALIPVVAWFVRRLLSF